MVKDRLLTLLVVVMVGVCLGEEMGDSLVKLRIYKDFIKDVAEQNLKMVFARTEELQLSDVYLKELDTKLTNLRMNIQPNSRQQKKIDTELLLDEGQIVLEMHGLEFTGTGRLMDPETKKTQKITLSAPINTAQIIITLGESLTEWKTFHPKIEFNEVIFSVVESMVEVKARGELPLYKTHNFESSVKAWFLRELQKREKDFKDMLQQMERYAWQQLPLSQTFYSGVTLNSSLAEPLMIKGDYIHGVFMNEFDNLDHKDFKKPLRNVKGTFSEENDFRRDVQVLFDENFINHQFLGLFYTKNQVSLTEELIKMIPDNFQAFGKIASTFFQVVVFAHLFPDLLKEFEGQQKVDVRCGFSPSFLDGKINDIYVSQVWFKDHNTVEYNFHFGCGLFVHNNTEENAFYWMQPISTESPYWTNWRSFFYSLSGKFSVNVLGAGAGPIRENAQFVKYNVNEVDLNVEEFHVYRGDQEVASEKEYYAQRLNALKEKINQSSLQQVLTSELFPKGIPVSPFPNIQRCLGLDVQDLEMEILEGFLRLAYDFKVSPADESCFFSMFEKKEDRYKRIADAFNFKIPENLGKKLFGIGKQLAKKTGWF